MTYTAGQLAKLAGVSARTLRYYDEIGLLCPARLPSGYRIYDERAVDTLQHILLLRELDMPLSAIRDIIRAPHFDALAALRSHRERLSEQRNRLDRLLHSVEQTIRMKEGEITMNDHERFEGFKREALERNEAQYGEEIRTLYGEEAVDRAAEQWMNMTPEQYDAVQDTERRLRDTLLRAMDDGDPTGALAQEAADLHRQWISAMWGRYSKEAHEGVTQMYVDDERFAAYYDVWRPGAAAFLRDAVHAYTAQMA